MRLFQSLALLTVLCFLVSIEGEDTSVVPKPPSQPLYKIEGKVLGAGSLRGSPLRVIVDGGQTYTFVRSDGSFIIHDVPAGAHLVEIFHNDFAFFPVRVDISSKNKGRVKASVADDSRHPLPYPLVMEPIQRIMFFEPREEFSLISILKQPYILISVVLPLAMVGLYKLVDPAQLQQQADGNGDRPAPAEEQPNNPKRLLNEIFQIDR